MEDNNQIFGIGYSTHPFEKFIELLQAHGIQKIIDVRAIPNSAHCPDYHQDNLKKGLKKYKIAYRQLKKLGGRRHTHKGSPNTGWINTSFRGFADYMQTKDFHEGLAQLEKLARKKRCVLMCAEGASYRCHRSLIADALTLSKWQFLHIQSKKSVKPHRLTPFLRVKNGQIIYPP